MCSRIKVVYDSFYQNDALFVFQTFNISINRSQLCICNVVDCVTMKDYVKKIANTENDNNKFEPEKLNQFV